MTAVGLTLAHDGVMAKRKMTYSVHVHFATADKARCLDEKFETLDAALRRAREYTSDAKAVWVTMSGYGGVATEWVKRYAGMNQ